MNDDGGSTRSVTASDSQLRIILADDHEIVRDGLKALVNSQPDMQVVGEATNGEEAWALARDLAPDMIVMDLSMPLVAGAAATARIRRDLPTVKVVVLSVHDERVFITRLLRAGASGYVLKGAASGDLIKALRTVASGGTYIDPSIAGTLVKSYVEAAEAADEPKVLSERERDVLLRIARGFSNREIAAELALSVKTVETYKARVTAKLGLRTRVDIVRYAEARGWLSGSTASEHN